MSIESDNPYQAPTSLVGECDSNDVWQSQLEYVLDKRDLRRAIRVYVTNFPVVALCCMSIFAIAVGLIGLLESMYGPSLGGSPYVVATSILGSGGTAIFLLVFMFRFFTYRKIIRDPLLCPGTIKQVHFSELRLSIRCENLTEEIFFSDILWRGESDKFIILDVSPLRFLVIPARRFEHKGAYLDFKNHLKSRMSRSWFKRLFLLR